MYRPQEEVQRIINPEKKQEEVKLPEANGVTIPEASAPVEEVLRKYYLYARELTSQQSAEVTAECAKKEAEYREALNKLPPEIREKEEIQKAIKELGHKARTEWREAVAAQTPEADAWYKAAGKAILQTVTGAVEAGIDVTVGNAVSVVSAGKALAEGKSLGDVKEAWVQSGADFINGNRAVFNQHLGGSYLGEDAEFGQRTNAGLFAQTWLNAGTLALGGAGGALGEGGSLLTKAVQGAKTLTTVAGVKAAAVAGGEAIAKAAVSSLSKANITEAVTGFARISAYNGGIQGGLAGAEAAKDKVEKKAVEAEVGREVTESEFEKAKESSTALKATDYLFDAAKIAGSAYAVVKGQGIKGAKEQAQAILKMTEVAGLMAGASAAGQELYLKGEDGGKLDLERFLKNSVKGTADSMVFMGAIGVGTSRALDKTLKQGIIPPVDKVAKITATSELIDLIDGAQGFGDSIKMAEHATNWWQVAGTAVQTGVNVADTFDAKMAGMGAKNDSSQGALGAYLPDGSIELDLAKIQGLTAGYNIESSRLSELVYAHELFHGVVKKSGVVVKDEDALVNALARRALGVSISGDNEIARSYFRELHIQSARCSQSKVPKESLEIMKGLVGDLDGSQIKLSSPEFLSAMHQLGIKYDVNPVDMTDGHINDLKQNPETRFAVGLSIANDVDYDLVKVNTFKVLISEAEQAIMNANLGAQTGISHAVLDRNIGLNSQRLATLVFLEKVADRYRLTLAEREKLEALFDTDVRSPIEENLAAVPRKANLYSYIMSQAEETSLQRLLDDMHDVFSEENIHSGKLTSQPEGIDAILNTVNRLSQPDKYSLIYANAKNDAGLVYSLSDDFYACVDKAREVAGISIPVAEQRAYQQVREQKKEIYQLLADNREYLGEDADIEYLADGLATLTVVAKHDDRNVAKLLETTDPENKALQLAGLLHDIGKSSAAGSRPGNENLIANIYAITDAADKNTPIGLFLADKRELQRGIVAVQNPYTGKPFSLADPIGEFWGAHSLWSVQILKQAGVDPKIVEMAAQHHAVDVENGSPVFQQVDAQKRRITKSDVSLVPIEPDALKLFTADQYDAARARGEKTHEEAIEYLRRKAIELSNAVPELQNLIEKSSVDYQQHIKCAF